MSSGSYSIITDYQDRHQADLRGKPKLSSFSDWFVENMGITAVAFQYKEYWLTFRDKGGGGLMGYFGSN